MSEEEAIRQLNDAFIWINERYYKSKLTPPDIIFNDCFHRSTSKGFIYDGSVHLIQIDKQCVAEGNRERALLLLLAGTVMHWGYINNVKVSSNRGYYLNKRFKKEAERIGIICGKTKYGFNVLSVNDSWQDSLRDSPQFLPEAVGSTLSNLKSKPKSKSSTIIYKCKCGKTYRATRQGFPATICPYCIEDNEGHKAFKAYDALFDFAMKSGFKLSLMEPETKR